MDWAFDITYKNRKIFEKYLNTLSLEQLNHIPKGFNNNIIWNIAHVIATQQILVYGLTETKPLVEEGFLMAYRKGSKPLKKVTQVEIGRIKKLLFSTLEQTKIDFESGLFQKYMTYTTSTESTLTKVEDAIEFNNFHEGIHLGYILAQLKLL